MIQASVVFLTLLSTLPVNVPAVSLKDREANIRSPVILVPGYSGNQLEAKLNKSQTVHNFCSKTSDDYFSLWLNLELMLPFVLDCWVDNMRMVYDNVTRKTSNSPGVDIRVPGFGDTSSVEWLDPTEIIPGAYFNSIVEHLVTLGYTRGVDIRGAPFDFRKAPNEMDKYYADIKRLTEATYEQNFQNKVTFVCHSMGCPVISYFFNQQNQAWKEKYIHGLISLGGVWGGAVKALKTFASGENLGFHVIRQLTIRTEQRTCPSMAFMLPSDKLWTRDEVLVSTPTKNYSISNFNDFFQDIGFPDGYEMYKDTYSYASTGMNPPGVEVHCLHGINAQTIERLYFEEGDFPDSPDLIYGNGDGTVNARSLEACTQWQNNQNQKVSHVPLFNVDHMAILTNSNVLNYIQKVVML